MLNRSSHFKTAFASLVVIVSSLTVIGCAKKVSPVAGSEGLAQGGQSSSQSAASDSASPQDGSDRKMGSSGRSEDMASSGGSGISKSGNNMASSGSGSGMTTPGATSFSKNVYFDFDAWKIRSDAKDILTENARWLVANSRAKIQIEGHGDARGTSEYNLALGERRARSTKRYLANLGVSPSRISFISFGEEKNICSEQVEPCFQKNRRAHFIVK